MNQDQFNLDRFLQAQKSQYETAISELRRGVKESHWIWFVFPQLRALGKSPTAQHFGLGSIEEAIAYWEHPTLGQRLRESLEAILQVRDKSAAAILGDVDALKFRSCLTLFLEVAPSDQQLQAALARFYAGEPDDLTLALLGREPNET